MAERAAGVLVAVTLVATIATRLGIAPAGPVAYLAAVLAAFALAQGLGRLARTILLVAVVTVVLATFRAPVNAAAFEPALFAFAFVLATGLLREIALRDPSFRSIGEGLVGMRGARRFPLVSLGVALAGLTLLIGALQFLAGLVAERGGAAGGRSRVDVLRAGLAGYLLIPMLSPLAIPFIVVSSLVPDLVWGETLPLMLAVAAATWALACLQDRISAEDEGAVIGPAAAPFDPNPVLKAVAPVVLAALLHWGAGLRLGDAAIVAICLVALVWALLLADGGPAVSGGVVSARNEAVIIGGSIATGVSILALVPEMGAALPLASLPAAALPPLFVAAFVLPGLVGVQPALCFMMLMPAIEALSQAAPAAVTPVLAAVIAGWALNSATSPFGLPILIVARAGRITTLEFLVARNGVFTACAPLVAAALLGLAAG